MALIGNDFVPEVRKANIRCSECHQWIGTGSTCLVSLKNGKVQKRVCGEDCRLEFDAKFWANAARKNSIHRGLKRIAKEV